MFVASIATSWGDSARTSVAAALAVLLSGIPKIIGFLVIVLIGWLIAAIVAKAITAVLHAVKFNHMADRAGISGFVRDMGMTADASSVVAMTVKWFIRLVALVAAFDALGLPVVSSVLEKFLLWIPNLIVAMVVLVIGGLLASALSRAVRGATAEAGLGNPEMLGNLARYAVIAFAVLIAVNQIGVATTLVNTLFMGLVFAVALAAALAFGLGGRETAAQIVQSWYRTGQQAAPQMQQAARAASEQAQAMAGSNGTATTSVDVERRPLS